MKKWRYSAWLVVLTALALRAQPPLEAVRAVPLGVVAHASLDRNGHLFVADERGNINKYTSEGQPLLHFSPQKLAVPDLLEAWFTLRIFAFYQEYQEYLLLDRFLHNSPLIRFAPDAVGFARSATLAADNLIWVFDDTDFSLKKYDPQTRQNVLVSPLALQLETPWVQVGFMREYQNQLYVSDERNGLLVFDNLGNYRKRLPFAGLAQFGFYRDELYFLRGNELVFFHLYNFQERTVPLVLPASPVRQVLVVPTHVLLLTDRALEVYPLP